MIGRFIVSLTCVAFVMGGAYAQERKPSPREVGSVRDCAKKYADDTTEGERHCLFILVATPCTKTAGGNTGSADCYRIEAAIWDELLNENFKSLRETLDDAQTSKLRDMQRAWIGYRDTTCSFYSDKIQGSMAVPLQAACVARETARRALLLKFFSGL
jgi:uncharacterized protein YecT (DUF1311 family)